MEAPIPIRAMLGDISSLLRRIIAVAEHPHLSIPETKAWRSPMQYDRLIDRSIMFVSGMCVLNCLISYTNQNEP